MTQLIRIPRLYLEICVVNKVAFILTIMLFSLSFQLQAQMSVDHNIEVVLVETIGANIESKHRNVALNPLVFQIDQPIEMEEALNIGICASEDWLLYIDLNTVNLQGKENKPNFSFKSEKQPSYKNLSEESELLSAGSDFVKGDGYQVGVDYQVDSRNRASAELNLVYTLTVR